MHQRFHAGAGLRNLIEKATRKVGRPGIVILEKRYGENEVEFHDDTFFEFCQALVDLVTNEDWREMHYYVRTRSDPFGPLSTEHVIHGRDFKTRKEFERAQQAAAEHEARFEHDSRYRRDYEARELERRTAAEHRMLEAQQQEARQRLEAQARSMADGMSKTIMGTIGVDLAKEEDWTTVGLVTSKKKPAATPAVDVTKLVSENFQDNDVKRLK